MLVIKSIYILILILVTIPVLVVSAQIFIAILTTKQKIIKPKKYADLKVCILIPAHNESVNILPTLDSINSNDVSTLKIVVVADNCNDDTADVARQYGVDVVERHDNSKRGKGYALDFGINYLRQFSPDIVIILDADCIVDDNAIDQLIEMAVNTGRPVQANYLMFNKSSSVSIKMKIAEFGWLLKNYVRPLGFSIMNLPCQLTGSGMAFPWRHISQINFATGHIVEDMKLGLDAAEVGAAPVFCPNAKVYSYFPLNEEGVKSQRTRWEHGHLGIIFKDVPHILLKAILKKNVHLFAMGIDLLVPPLSLMAITLILLILVSLLLTTALSFPAVFLTFTISLEALFALSIYCFWISFGRKVITLRELLSIPYFILMKIPIYVRFLFKRQTEWVRSKRDS